MNQLQRAALARLPLSVEVVERLYEAKIPNWVDTLYSSRVIRDLCESHERLRAELDGSAVVIADLGREVLALRREREQLADRLEM